MGCVPSENKNESRLTSMDYKMIWSKCLNTKSVVINKNKKKDHPAFEQIAKDIDRTFPDHEFFRNQLNKECF